MIYTYYFNGSGGAPIDPDGAWSNDANAFDGSIVTYSQTGNASGDVNTNELQSNGTNAPLGEEAITQVRVRHYTYINNAANIVKSAVYTESRGELLGTASRTGDSEVDKWSDYTTLSEPSNGWSWAHLQNLECVSYTEMGGMTTQRLFKVELEVTTDPTRFKYYLDGSASSSSTTAYFYPQTCTSGSFTNPENASSDDGLYATLTDPTSGIIVQANVGLFLEAKIQALTSTPTTYTFSGNWSYWGAASQNTFNLDVIGSNPGLFDNGFSLEIFNDGYDQAVYCNEFLKPPIPYGSQISNLEFQVRAYYSGGVIYVDYARSKISYSIVGSVDNNNVWSNDANAYDGDTSTSTYCATAGGTENFLQINGTNAPSVKEETIITVKARSYYGAWTDYTTLNTPDGGWTWDKVKNLSSLSWVYPADEGDSPVHHMIDLTEDINYGYELAQFDQPVTPNAFNYIEIEVNAGLPNYNIDFENNSLSPLYTYGNAPWTVVSPATGSDGYFIESGDISDEQSSAVAMNVVVGTGGGLVSFRAKVSSETNYDRLIFRVDGQIFVGLSVIEISGEVDWGNYSAALDAGEHLLEWSYEKDSSVSNYDDKASIDNINFINIDQVNNLLFYENFEAVSVDVSEANAYQAFQGGSATNWSVTTSYPQSGDFSYTSTNGAAHVSRYTTSVHPASDEFNLEGWVRCVSGGTNLAGLVFGHQASGNLGYQVIIDTRNSTGGSSSFQIRKDASSTPLASSTAATVSANTWYRVAVQWRTSGTRISAQLYDESGTELATLTSSDTSYTTGRLGLHAYNTVSFDNISLVGNTLLDFAPRYWVGSGTGKSWLDAANWSESSGGAGGASIPTPGTNVYFDANSPTSTIVHTALVFDGDILECNDFDTSSCANTISIAVGGSVDTSYLAVYGDVTLGNNVSINRNYKSNTTHMRLYGSGKTWTHNTASNIMGFQVETGGSYTLQNDMNDGSGGQISTRIGVTGGSWDFNDHDVNLYDNDWTESQVALIYMTSGTLSLGTGYLRASLFSVSGGILNQETSTLELHSEVGYSSATGYISASGYTLYDVIIDSDNTAEIYTIELDACHNFSIVPNNPTTVKFISNQTLTVTGLLDMTGDASNSITIQSLTNNVPSTINYSGQTFNGDHLIIKDMNGTNGTFNAGANSTDSGNNSGWFFGNVVTYYFDASDAGPTDVAGKWSSEANAFDGKLSTASTDLGIAPP